MTNRNNRLEKSSNIKPACAICMFIAACLWIVPKAASSKGKTYPVFDFCTIAMGVDDGSTFQKKRLLLTQISGLSKLDSGETKVNDKGKEVGTLNILPSVNARQRFMQLWMNTFPLKRFYNVTNTQKPFTTQNYIKKGYQERSLLSPSQQLLQ